jgi:hypothetical protein
MAEHSRLALVGVWQDLVIKVDIARLFDVCGYGIEKPLTVIRAVFVFFGRFFFARLV